MVLNEGEKVIAQAFNHREPTNNPSTTKDNPTTESLTTREGQSTKIGNLTTKTPTTSDNLVDTLITILQNELETKNHELDVKNNELDIKNEQIRELNARLAESNAALVAAQQMAQAEQMLHAGTMQKQLKEGEESSPEPDAAPKGFFSKLFRK